jgi:hypothetical protein
MQVRAKFKVHSITRSAGEPSAEVKLFAVNATSEDNKTWSRWTPSGEIRMSITNPEAVNALELGAEYYVDFTKAETPAGT